MVFEKSTEMSHLKVGILARKIQNSLAFVLLAML